MDGAGKGEFDGTGCGETFAAGEVPAPLLGIVGTGEGVAGLNVVSGPG